MAANGSLPATSVALPLRFQAGEPSKSPPGMSTYDESSFQLANGWLAWPAVAGAGLGLGGYRSRGGGGAQRDGRAEGENGVAD